MNSTQSAAAGWYPDTETDGTRYWDGSRWTGDARPRRKQFAAQSGHKMWGVILVGLGGLSLITSPANFAPPSSISTSSGSPGGIGGFIVTVLLGLGLAVWGVYLLRGEGVSTKAVAERASATTALESAMEQLKLERDKSKKPGASLVTAFLVAQAAATRRYGADANAHLSQSLTAIGFDQADVSSPLLGQIVGLSVHRDWIIAGTRALDLTQETRAAFHLDDRVQTVTTSKAKGKKVVTTATEVPRGGQLQLVTGDGSQSFAVGPNQVATARGLVEQINHRAEQLREGAAKASRGRSTAQAEQIKAISNPKTAKALQNLQNLLYTRVISDEEFERMKGKLLADPDSAEWG